VVRKKPAAALSITAAVFSLRGAAGCIELQRQQVLSRVSVTGQWSIKVN